MSSPVPSAESSPCVFIALLSASWSWASSCGADGPLALMRARAKGVRGGSWVEADASEGGRARPPLPPVCCASAAGML